MVKRYTDNVYISYDGDFAGQKADLRGLEILNEEALHVHVVPMPEGQDPDDVARQGAAAYQKCLDEAMPLIDYKIHALERKYDMTRTEEKRRFVKEALQIVAMGESESVKEELLKKLRDKTGITYHSLERDLQNAAKEPPPQQEMTLPQERFAETAAGTDKQRKALRFILAAKLFSSPYAKGLDLNGLPLSDETHIVIAQYILDRERKGERIRPSELFEVLDENCSELNEILDLNYGEKLTGEIAERFFADSVKTLQLEMIEREIANLNEEYAQATEEDKWKNIAQKLGDCIKRKNLLKRS
jgi:DNA primase